ncbi:hypothetical protein [uncultured Gammaproteobacteria bacterium]|jgi:hypothetical protein|uniref:Filamentation induced by cAMP protein Fic-like C-terminal domain-containing protein n=3 Tax=sulfur-oxidizing symbionts TaxID=32036 RepID=A0A1H6JM16_9GAMM|nr:ATP-dependent DNA helicase [Bathymodiolus azoricus thioautotrophic gill symbiont]CAB5508074.1 ATP-dependent DNA helicase [Bathymodiolus thermophilus thioautotrophic gill symbiont]CAC9427460.1 hypothetical protein [uncultured Gammaproteobacteria bacterium]CAC9495382.1 hypothetical protein [uncultured Gammaproteobacteria bacterium]CAC9503786.1 hypothetical protein [uncultured Gammaproteobacteria bacterium]
MRWLKGKKPPVNKAKNDLNGDLFGFDDTQSEGLNNKTRKNKALESLKAIKAKNKQLKTTREQVKNLKELSESAKDFKRNNINKTGKTQEYFNFSKNIDISVIKTSNGTKKGLSKNNKEITQEQIKILKNCKSENTASELRKISKRTNKSKFKENVLDPLIHFGFFELTVPNSPRSPNQKYRLTGKFVRKIQKN